MIKINGREYKLAQLDTNILSEMVKHPERELANYLRRYLVDQEFPYVPSVSAFTLLEIMDAAGVYDGFLDNFSTFPCMILKGYEDLLKEEIDAYPDPKHISPALLTTMSFDPKPGQHRRDALHELLQSDHIQGRRGYWIESKTEILEGMLGLIDNFPSKGASYDKSEVRHFGREASFQQLCIRSPDFVQRALDSGGNVAIDAFPSIKAMTYTVFYKFYVDKSRNPVMSDVFDVVMAATIPYVDCVFTEGHQAQVLRKVTGVDDFCDGLEVRTVRDLR